MSELPPPPAATSKLKSTTGVNWAAGLVVAMVLGHILGLIVVAVTNEWLEWFLLGFLGLILAAGVGFAVRFTSSGNGFWPALITAGLGAHVISTLSGSGFDYLGEALVSVYHWNPLSGYGVFVGLLAALVATIGRKA